MPQYRTRNGVGGTLASTERPTAITDPLYDANNRLTRWNGKTFQYDANGNMINDGERSYSWNARDELQGLGGTQSASFRYDPMGRRSAKTISTTTTDYLYDGLDFVQELNGTTSSSGVKANLIIEGLDEPLLRITGTGSTATLSHFFSDANNNVIALTDSTQAIATKYSYGAYGQSKQTTVSGATNTNSQQDTGRENDGTGLMYYRARYYHVGWARFISEDPIGWASGQTNNYAYVGGDPISNKDALGLFSTPQHIAITRAALGPCGFSFTDTWTLAKASAAGDWTPTWNDSQDPLNANWHAMSKVGQNAADAKAATEAFIREQMALGTTESIGRAIHAAQDMAARGHAGYQTYTGDLSLKHMKGDFYPTPKEIGQAIQNTRNLFSQCAMP